jgi:hypothetical protein
MLSVILAVLAALIFPGVMIPAVLLAWVTPLTLWPTAAVIFALYIIGDTLFS